MTYDQWTPEDRKKLAAMMRPHDQQSALAEAAATRRKQWEADRRRMRRAARWTLAVIGAALIVGLVPFLVEITP